jgi:hypothetical protein
MVLAGVAVLGLPQRQVWVNFMQPVLNVVSVWAHWELVCQQAGAAEASGWQ